MLFALIGTQVTFRRASTTRIHGTSAPDGSPPVSDPRFRSMMEALAQLSLHEGNQIELLTDGIGTYPRLWEDLRSAKRSITFQVYAIDPGRVADTLHAVLCERALAGVQVLFLADALGTQKLPEDYFDGLRRAGVAVAVFRPVRWNTLHAAQHRAHCRAVVIDGRIGYTGGFGMSDEWCGDGRHPGQWRETNVRFEGPAVLRLQAAFAVMWEEATGTLLTGERLFPSTDPRSRGAQIAGILFSTPSIGSTPAERFFSLSVAGAREMLYITNAYFAPNDFLCSLLKQAAEQGVDIRILAASKRIDWKAVRWAGRARYEELLAAGVRIFEYQPSMVHAKTVVVDSMWCSIGTLNLDNRGLVLNSETNLLALDRRLGRRMDDLFLQDLGYAKEIRLETFRERPWKERLLEHCATFLSRLI